jgi:hypothetical protein
MTAWTTPGSGEQESVTRFKMMAIINKIQIMSRII